MAPHSKVLSSERVWNAGYFDSFAVHVFGSAEYAHICCRTYLQDQGKNRLLIDLGVCHRRACCGLAATPLICVEAPDEKSWRQNS